MENNVADEVLEKLCKNGVIVYDKLPKDWKIIKDATTNPKGYKWINNGKSRQVHRWVSKSGLDKC